MNALQLSPAAQAFRYPENMRPSMGTSGSERRRYARIDTRFAGKIYTDYQYSDCTIVDLCENGARIRPGSVFVPRDVSIQIPGLGTVASRVVWRRRGQVGLQFRTGPGDIGQAISSYLAKVRPLH